MKLHLSGEGIENGSAVVAGWAELFKYLDHELLNFVVFYNFDLKVCRGDFLYASCLLPLFGLINVGLLFIVEEAINDLCQIRSDLFFLRHECLKGHYGPPHVGLVSLLFAELYYTVCIFLCPERVKIGP